MTESHKAAKAAFERELAQVSAAQLATMVEVTITRNPASTVVIIDGQELLHDINTLPLPIGKHKLEVAIAGKGGDAGAGSVKKPDGSTIATATARIPAGMTASFSPQEPFNV